MPEIHEGFKQNKEYSIIFGLGKLTVAAVFFSGHPTPLLAIEMMTSENKKALLLLNSVIFNYHGFDKEEQLILEEIANGLEAPEELSWVKEFVQKDVPSLFERAREFFKTTIGTYDKDTKVSYLNRVWDATNRKGHITEMEAMAILKLARDWGVQKEFLGMVRR